MLQEAGQNPTRNQYLLELMSVCLAMGFQGRYRLEPDGKEKISQIRSWLADVIRRVRGTPEAALSVHWQGVSTQRSGMMQLIPAWVFFACALALVALLYLGLMFSLARTAHPVYAAVQNLDMDVSGLALPKVAEPPPPVDRAEFLAGFLAPEIRAGLVSIHDDGRRIEIRGDQGLFTSGSEALIPEREALVDKIADALASREYAHREYQVVGHSDNVQMRTSSRFENNWVLSSARAKTISERLQARQPALVLRTEGVADSQPVGDNNTREGRARNRRVEVVLE
ncbi:MAG: DotU/TssL family secretion system protein [Thiolinea sp.]